MVKRRIDRAEKAAKGDKKYLREVEVLGKLLEYMDSGAAARSFPGEPDEMELIRSMDLLTIKPIIYAANMDEDSFAAGIKGNEYFAAVASIASAEGAEVLPICAKLEREILELPDEEKAEFLSELGLTESGLNRLIRVSYHLLGLISFLTAGPDEVRAWTITNGSRAPQAAGKIHSDFERGFIRAEIVAFNDLETHSTMASCREKGLIRSEGKEYVMKDGDVTLFRFNV